MLQSPSSLPRGAELDRRGGLFSADSVSAVDGERRETGMRASGPGDCGDAVEARRAPGDESRRIGRIVGLLRSGDEHMLVVRVCKAARGADIGADGTPCRPGASAWVGAWEWADHKVHRPRCGGGAGARVSAYAVELWDIGAVLLRRVYMCEDVGERPGGVVECLALAHDTDPSVTREANDASRRLRRTRRLVQ